MKVITPQAQLDLTRSDNAGGAFKKLMNAHYPPYKENNIWLPGFRSAKEEESLTHHFIEITVKMDTGARTARVFRSNKYWYATFQYTSSGDAIPVDSKTIKKCVVYCKEEDLCWGPFDTPDEAVARAKLRWMGGYFLDDKNRTCSIHDINIPE